jgi:endonuclease YncB( thermonuclease family)
MRRALLTLGIFLAMNLAVSADDLAGQASIIDGDTLEIHGTRIRLWGIDARESDQLCRNEDGEHYHCGQNAATYLDAFLARRPVRSASSSKNWRLIFVAWRTILKP